MSKSSILIVEDERIVALDIQSSLENCGYLVVGQTDRGEEAVQKAAELRPDLVLMDIGLKGEMDGIEAAEQIRRRLDVPVIFLTAFADQSTLERARLAEPFGYILKPFDQRELVSNIELTLYKHRLEHNLRESEERYRSLFETMAQGVVYQDREGKIISANPAARQILGLTMDQMQGQTSIDPRWQALHEDGSAFPGESHPAMVALRTGQPVRDVLMSVYNPEKEAYVWIMVDAMPQYRPGASQPDRVFATFTDITLRKQAEQAVREANLVVENSPVVLFRRKPVAGWPVEMVSQNVSQFGYTPEELLSGAVLFASMVYPEDLERVAREVQEYSASGAEQFQQEYRIVTKDGSVRWLDDRTVVQRNSAGQVVFYQGVVIDVTERKQAETELRKLTQAVEQSANVVVVTDVEGKIEYVNPKFVEITGYSLAEASGQNPRIISSHEHSVEFYQQLWQTIKSGGVWKGEFHNKRKDGRLYWEDATIAPVYDPAGKLVNFIAVKEDITVRKTLEAAERDQRQLAEALRDTSVALNSTLKLDEVLDRILDNIGRMAPYDAVVLLLIEGEVARISRQRSSFPLHPEQNAGEAQLKLADLPILQSLLETRQPCLISDTQTDPGWRSIIPNAQWVRSFVSIPLEIRGNIVGAINLASAKPEFFSTEQVERFQAFASQAAVAIENARLYEQAQYLSTTDPLTELNNRRYLFDIGSFELARIGRYGGCMSAIMIDIDHFKNLNDIYGHAMGDLALREVARRIKNCVRTVDIVARYGGEEFVILMPETGLQAALHVAERIRQSVAESSVVDHGLGVCTTLSLGVAEIDPDCKNLDDLLKCADQALYAAKAAGRNRPASYPTSGGF